MAMFCPVTEIAAWYAARALRPIWNEVPNRATVYLLAGETPALPDCIHPHICAGLLMLAAWSI